MKMKTKSFLTIYEKIKLAAAEVNFVYDVWP